MEWNKYTIKTKSSAEDAICGALLALDINGFEIEDKVPLSKEDKEAMYIDILPDLGEDDGIAFVSFYLEENEEECKMLKAVKESLDNLKEYVDLGEASIISSHTREEDWINNWKEFFKPFEVEDIIIKPTWEQLDIANEDKTIIEIDPGTAFGTGRHETTKLCIRQLKKYVKEGDKVLDLGCGSGILSIVASKLGAASVFGTDIDERAVVSANENIEINKIAANDCKMVCGNVLEEPELRAEIEALESDVVVANIFADVIILLAQYVKAFMKKNGIFISSGIINTKEEEVKQAIIDGGLSIVEVEHMGDWVSIIATRWE